MNSQVEIREYEEIDFKHLVSWMKFLQEHVVAVDNYHLNILKDWYPEIYARKSLERVTANDGKIFCAYSWEIFLGCIICLIEEAVPENSKDSLQEFIVGKTGEIKELIVLPESRWLWIWKLLMQKGEQYFIEKNCKFSYLDVFWPNKLARDFYEKWGYEERMVTMIKPL